MSRRNPGDITPSGCAADGIAEQIHLTRYMPDEGWHQHIPPSTPQILARMRHRRALREMAARDRQRAAGGIR